MKILNHLTLKHLSMNKKRTLVTIIGIVLSTALMVGIGLLVSTFLSAMQKDAMRYSGSYFASFLNVTTKEKEVIKENVNVDNYYSYGILGYAPIESDNFYKPYLYVVSGDEAIFKEETLTSGRLPLNDEEIILPNHLENTKYKLNDTITLDIGVRQLDDEEVIDNNTSLRVIYDEENHKEVIKEKIIKQKTKSYKIVGFYNRSSFESYQAPGYMAYTYNSNTSFNNVYVTYKNVKKTYDYTDEICSSLKGVKCETNDNLLYYYGVSHYDNVNTSLIIIMVIVLSLLSFGSFIVIYNSFAISTMERKKSFGLYSSLGATPKQLRYTVFFEAFVVGVIGIILGILGSFLGIYIVILILNHLLKNTLNFNLIFTVNSLYIIIPLIFMIVTIFISAYLPAKKASKISPISLIRENGEIKIPKRKFKTPKWIFKLFGMEGEIALKNIKRNKRTYRITLLSLFMSIVLFISFSTYLTLMLKAINMEDAPHYDLYVLSSDDTKIEEIRKNPLVTYSYKMKSDTFDIKTDKISSMINESYKDYPGNSDSMSATFMVFDEDSFIKIKENFGISQDIPIFYNQASYTDFSNNSRKSYQIEVFKNNISTLNICNMDESVCEDINVVMTNKQDDFISTLKMATPVIMASSKMVANSSLIKSYHNDVNILYVFSDEYEKLYNELSESYKNDKEFTLYAPKIELKQINDTILALKILFYGFITLVTLIGVTSVFNTIYTSIYLRKKEFAMLRSIGLSPKGFNRMLFFESFFFGFKSLLYSLPVSFIMIYLINLSTGSLYDFGHIIVPYKAILIAVLGVFILILMTTLYSARKIKKENILDALKDENI